MSQNPFRLVMSPLTRTMYAGRVKEHDGYAESVGQRHDVTADFYQCLVQLVESYGGKFTINYANGSQAYAVTVTAAAPAA